MTKRFFALLLVTLLAFPVLKAQTETTPYTGSNSQEESKPVVFRDRLILDMFHDFWMGVPTEVNHLKFDPGFNVSAIWDFKIKNKPIAVGLGVGVTYHTQYSDALLQYDKDKDMMMYYILPENLNTSLLKMNYLSCNIPVEFRYRNPNGFKFTVGARAGLIAEISQKYKGEDPANPSDTLMYKNLNINNKLKYNIDVYTRIGWKFINVYYSFQPTALFIKGKGPKICPMSVGLSLSIF